MKKSKFIIYLVVSVFLTLGFSISLQSLFAWTEPTDAPPGGNVSPFFSIADGSVITAKLFDGAVTNDKITSVDFSKVTGDVPTARLSGSLILSSTTGVDNDFCKKITGHDCGYDVDEEAAAPLVPDLVNGQHFSSQCTGLAGVVVSDGSDDFCRFNDSSCPVGWVQYKNWTTMANSTVTCDGNCWYLVPTGMFTFEVACDEAADSSCTAVGHSWSDQVADTCSTSLPSCPASDREPGCRPTPTTCAIAAGMFPSTSSITTQIGCY